MPQAAASSVEVASCIFAQRMQRRTRTEATGWRTSMEWAEPGSEEVEDEEEDEAEPWRGLGRVLECMLGGLVGVLMVCFCCMLAWCGLATRVVCWALGLVVVVLLLLEAGLRQLLLGQAKVCVCVCVYISSCCGVSSRGMERRDQRRLRNEVGAGWYM